MVKIARQLHLVIPIYGSMEDEVPSSYVHSTPISRQVFEDNYLILAKTYSNIIGEGMGAIAGPRVAAMVMRTAAKDLKINGDVLSGLFAEIFRLSNYLAPGERGWEMTPVEEALRTGKMSQEDWSEVENSITFFTVAYCMESRRTSAAVLNFAANLSGASVEWLSCTEYLTSLQTSMQAAATGKSSVQEDSSQSASTLRAGQDFPT